MRMFAALVALVTVAAGTSFASPITKVKNEVSAKASPSVVVSQARRAIGHKSRKAHVKMAKSELPKRTVKGRFAPRKKA